MAGKTSEGSGDLDENSEINVTPFIDVMLVLLIIFMVAAPLATVDMKVDLPQSVAKRLVDYGELMTVMNLIQNAGYAKIALVGLEAAPAR
ncbi:hypothetical protein BMJ22_26965 [Sinorhizobium medicae]|nr:hypothetical protein BMJ22_26965 [Sinorhizobium medicae]